MDGQKRVVVDDFKAKNGQGLNEFLPRLDRELVVNSQVSVL